MYVPSVWVSLIDNFPGSLKTKQNTCGLKACQTPGSVISKCLVTGYQASALSLPGINALEDPCLAAVLLVAMLQFAALTRTDLWRDAVQQGHPTKEIE